MKLFPDEQQTRSLRQEVMSIADRVPDPFMEGCSLQLQGWLDGIQPLMDD